MSWSETSNFNSVSQSDTKINKKCRTKGKQGCFKLLCVDYSVFPSCHENGETNERTKSGAGGSCAEKEPGAFFQITRVTRSRISGIWWHLSSALCIFNHNNYCNVVWRNAKPFWTKAFTQSGTLLQLTVIQNQSWAKNPLVGVGDHRWSGLRALRFQFNEG